MEFKYGDVVVCVDGCDYKNLIEGNHYIVRSEVSSQGCIDVETDNQVIIEDASTGRFKLLTEDEVKGILEEKGNHYKQASVEVIELMKENFGAQAVIDFCKLNAFKYISRCMKKGNEAGDLFKAENYLHYIRTGEWL